MAKPFACPENDLKKFEAITKLMIQPKENYSVGHILTFLWFESKAELLEKLLNKLPSLTLGWAEVLNTIVIIEYCPAEISDVRTNSLRAERCPSGQRQAIGCLTATVLTGRHFK